MDEKKEAQIEKACAIAKIIIDNALDVVELLNLDKLNKTEKAYAIKHVTDVANFNIYAIRNQPTIDKKFPKGGIVGSGGANECAIPINIGEHVIKKEQLFDMAKINSEIDRMNNA